MDDTVDNRFEQFVMYAVSEFKLYASYMNVVAGDSTRADVSGCHKYINTFFGNGLTKMIEANSATSSVAQAILDTKLLPMGKAVGAGVKFLEQQMESRKGNHIANFLIGFNPSDPNEKWTEFLADVFADIFIHFNVQICHLLADTKDRWTACLSDLAKDATSRIFNYLWNSTSKDEKMSKKLILDSFLNGDSKWDFYTALKGVARMKLPHRRGKEFETKSGTTFDAKSLIEKPIIYAKNSSEILLEKFFYKKEKEYFCRKAFPFELDICKHFQNPPKNIISKIIDHDLFDYFVKEKFKLIQNVLTRLSSKKTRTLLSIKQLETTFEGFKKDVVEILRKNLTQTDSGQMRYTQDEIDMFCNKMETFQSEHHSLLIGNIHGIHQRLYGMQYNFQKDSKFMMQNMTEIKAMVNKVLVSSKTDKVNAINFS